MQRFSSTGPATSPATVGEAENVSKSFGETRALVDVSLTVQPGECHALVGRNGAGKSTLVTLFTGLNKPDRGAIRLAGEAAPSLRSEEHTSELQSRFDLVCRLLLEK